MSRPQTPGGSPQTLQSQSQYIAVFGNLALLTRTESAYFAAFGNSAPLTYATFLSPPRRTGILNSVPSESVT
jgi:hypothetical protein